MPAISPVERIAPIYAVAVALVAGDALGNFHIATPLWLAPMLALIALAGFISARPALGLGAAYLAIAMTANVAVVNMLEPPRTTHSVTNMVEAK